MIDNLTLVFESLLSILRKRQPQLPITSIVNQTTVDLMCKVLSENGYASVAAQCNGSDVENMMDFTLCLIGKGHLSGSDRPRARRLMFKVLKINPTIPRSLFVNEVWMPPSPDHIGIGGFGKVLKGKLRRNFVAMKLLYKTQNDLDFCREALMWRSLNHPLVLPFLGIHESASHFFLISPYMKNGTISEWRKSVDPSTAEIKQRILEVAQGLEYIHSEGAFHGDLRGANILLDDDLHVQIADFGLTRINEATVTHSQAFTYNFAAPELFGYSETDDSNSDKTIKTQMSDVYAFGCLYYEIHYDAIPFAGMTNIQVMKRVVEGGRPLRMNKPPMDDGVWALISRCWEMKANQRPTIAFIAKYMGVSESPVHLSLYGAIAEILCELAIIGALIYVYYTSQLS